jgi:hypothetical protein
MKEYKAILNMILTLENELEAKRQSVKIGGGQNLDLVNEPLYNQAQALRWVLNIELDEKIDEIDIELVAGNYK